MRNPLLMFLFLSALFFAVIGCNNVKTPEELKSLVPVTVTVMNGSQPVEGVAVSLSGKGTQGAFACTGVTNTQGIAQIQSSRSSYTGKGAPPGTYVVVLNKTVDFPADLEPLETDQNLSAAAVAAKQTKRNEFLEKNQVIPKVLTLSDTSSIELQVVAKTDADIVVDLSKYK